MRTAIAIGIGLILSIMTTIGPVSAAEPTFHACVGQSVSTIASQFGRLFGQGVSYVAQNPTEYNFKNLGAGIQALQAGLIPDFTVTLPNGQKVLIDNTCNG